MDSRLCENLVNKNWRICGRKLQPYCYNHAQALEAIKSPLLDSEKRVTAGDLLLAIKICSWRADTVFDNLARLKRTLRDSYHLVMLETSQTRYIKAFQAFIAYRNDYFTIPDRAEQIHGGPKSLATYHGPELFGRLCSCLRRYNGAITEPQARSMPLGLMIYYDEVAGYLEGNGTAFVQDEDYE